MKMSEILQQARCGRLDLAAANMGSFGYSAKGLRILARYPSANYGLREAYRTFSAYRRNAELAWRNHA